MEREVGRSDAHEALAELTQRQRVLRTAYGAARYGWPEALASAWHRSPGRFSDSAPSCRVTLFLTALTDQG
jgi:hypothetical protein